MILFCPTCRFTLEPNEIDAVMYKKTQPKHCGASMQLLDHSPEPAVREEPTKEEPAKEAPVPEVVPEEVPKEEPAKKKGLFGLGGGGKTKKKAKK